MWSRTVGKRKYVDPDVGSLIERSGGLIDPYEVVRLCASALLQKLTEFEASFSSAFERICIIASLAGFEVKPFQGDRRGLRGHEAVIVPSASGNTKGTIFYNPDLPMPRIIFSIGHEITHSFFPPSTTGARFRSLSREGSKGARELEMLCHSGASELIMPLPEFSAAVIRHGFTFSSVDLIREPFETSFEACVYRMAQTASFRAAAGLFQFRRRMNEDVGLGNRNLNLFSNGDAEATAPPKKYRRRSFHASQCFPSELTIPWNKSVPETSLIYRAAQTRSLQGGFERITVDGRGKEIRCYLEAFPAPYQPEDVDPDHPDMLFLLTMNTA
jgi:IrrE N-terminal-like domain